VKGKGKGVLARGPRPREQIREKIRKKKLGPGQQRKERIQGGGTGCPPCRVKRGGQSEEALRLFIFMKK